MENSKFIKPEYWRVLETEGNFCVRGSAHNSESQQIPGCQYIRLETHPSPLHLFDMTPIYTYYCNHA